MRSDSMWLLLITIVVGKGAAHGRKVVRLQDRAAHPTHVCLEGRKGYEEPWAFAVCKMLCWLTFPTPAPALSSPQYLCVIRSKKMQHTSPTKSVALYILEYTDAGGVTWQKFGSLSTCPCIVLWKCPVPKYVLCLERLTCWALLMCATLCRRPHNWRSIKLIWGSSLMERLLPTAQQWTGLRREEEQVLFREKREKTSWSFCAVAPELGEAKVSPAVMKELRILKGLCATNKWSHSQLTFFL